MRRILITLLLFALGCDSKYVKEAEERKTDIKGYELEVPEVHGGTGGADFSGALVDPMPIGADSSPRPRIVDTKEAHGIETYDSALGGRDKVIDREGAEIKKALSPEQCDPEQIEEDLEEIQEKLEKIDDLIPDKR